MSAIYQRNLIDLIFLVIRKYCIRKLNGRLISLNIHHQLFLVERRRFVCTGGRGIRCSVHLQRGHCLHGDRAVPRKLVKVTDGGITHHGASAARGAIFLCRRADKFVVERQVRIMPFHLAQQLDNMAAVITPEHIVTGIDGGIRCVVVGIDGHRGPGVNINGYRYLRRE